MSVVIAVKDKDSVWVATDSQVSYAGTKKTITSQNCLKIWKPSGHKNMVMGLVGAVRDNNILSTVDYWIDEVDELKGNYGFKHVVRDTVPKIFSQLKEFGRVSVSKEGLEYMQSSVLIAYEDKMFEIDSDGCVTDEEDIIAIGSGFKHCLSAYGAIEDIDSLTIREKLIKTVAAACHADLYVQYPIIITNTKLDRYEIFDGEELYDATNGETLDMDGNYVDDISEEDMKAIEEIYEKEIEGKDLTDEEKVEILERICDEYMEKKEEEEDAE